MNISACFMVRNEETTIEKAILSVAPHVDEVCLLDTGSTDETPSIAKRLGAKVVREKAEQPFDFGHWRNRSIEEAKGDWILIMDGDEYLADVGDLKERTSEMLGKVDTILMPHRILGAKEAESASVITRLLSGAKVRKGDLFYQFPIHHQLVGVENFAVSTARTEEPYFDPLESAHRAIPALEKMLVLAERPILIGPGGKALGGQKKKHDREIGHAMLYLARSWAMIGSAAPRGSEERKKALEKAALYAGKLVDTQPGYLGAWLVLLAAVEDTKGLHFCGPIIDAALTNHMRCKDLHWWRMRVEAALLAILGSEPEAYPMVPQRHPTYMPRLAETGKFLEMRFGPAAQEEPPKEAAPCVSG